MGRDAEAKHWFWEFVVKDWLTDPAVSRCAPATRGIWFDALCNMFLLDRCGSVAGSYDELAVLFRASPDALRAAVAELKRTGAADVTVCRENVTLTNRRMKREYQIRVNARERKRKERGSHDPPDNGHGSVTTPPNPNPNPHPNSYSHPTQGGSGRVRGNAPGLGECGEGNLGSEMSRELQIALVNGDGFEQAGETIALLKSTGMYEPTIAAVMKFPTTTLARVKTEIEDIRRTGGAKTLAPVLAKRLGYRAKVKS